MRGAPKAVVTDKPVVVWLMPPDFWSRFHFGFAIGAGVSFGALAVILGGSLINIIAKAFFA